MNGALFGNVHVHSLQKINDGHTRIHCWKEKNTQTHMHTHTGLIASPGDTARPTLITGGSQTTTITVSYITHSMSMLMKMRRRLVVDGDISVSFVDSYVRLSVRPSICLFCPLLLCLHSFVPAIRN